MKKWAAAAAATLMLAACDKDGLYPGGSLQEGPIECLVLNEGLINTNEGCLSVVYRDSTVVVDAFQDANHRPMGDVAQSVTLINGKYFVAMNNSKKVEVMDPTTFQSLGTILYTQAGYPRQIVPISDTEAVVSDLRNQLVRIRTVEPYGEPLEYISIPAWIEYLIAAENKIFGMTSRGVMVSHLSEAYYIAAECLLGTDLGKARGYMDTMMAARGRQPLDADITSDDLLEEIKLEYLRETYGEGQAFYMFKRFFQVVGGVHNGQNTSSYAATDARYVVPLPESELINR